MNTKGMIGHLLYINIYYNNLNNLSLLDKTHVNTVIIPKLFTKTLKIPTVLVLINFKQIK